ncbi:MAG: FlgD immunoglobulin-like domain containing protein [bacterium]
MRRVLPLLALLLVLPSAVPAQGTKRALFDNFHAETAGNADWTIDNDQPTPLPAQSGIGPATPRTYWTGAISSWGVDLVKRGYTVTINNAAFTYGNTANPLDLANFDVLIVPEPNIRFTAAEKTAILAFVQAGGGLVAVGNHYISDRNNDGFDSGQIWNDLDPTGLLGVRFQSVGEPNNNIVQTSTNVSAAATDSVTSGPEGVVTALAFHNGATMTLRPDVNPTVRGKVWMNGLAQTSLTGVMAATSVYGNGRVFFLGDSSPIDDGSAQPGNTNIFDGWAEASDSILVLNATRWVTRRAAPPADVTAPAVTLLAPNGGEDWKAGSVRTVSWSATDAVGVTAVDLAWSADGGATWANGIATGLGNSGTYLWTVPDAPGGDLRVRATARDAAGNGASDASNSSFAISRWTVTASAGVGGSVSPAGTTGVVEGGSLTVGVTPASGFATQAIVVNGSPVALAPSVTFDAVAAHHTLTASFADVAPPQVALTAPAGGETWDLSSVHAIVWNASDNGGLDSVTVEYSGTGGTGPWTRLARVAAAAGQWAWTVLVPATDSAYVRVLATDAAGLSASARNAAAFRVRDLNAGVDPTPRALALARPWPNPARGLTHLSFALPTPGAVRLEVLDVSGRLVWSRQGAVEAGTHAWDWDGRDASGRLAGPGLYMVRLATPAGTVRSRFARVR